MQYVPIRKLIVLFISLLFRTSCSVACNKKHKETPCERPAPPELPHYHPAPLEALAKNGENDVNDDDEKELQLTDAQLGALDSHDEVQHKFRDRRIKVILRRIDSAKDRAKALEREMKDSAFLEFCDDILEAIGVQQVRHKPLSLEDLLLNHVPQ